MQFIDLFDDKTGLVDFSYEKITYFFDRTIAHIKRVILIQEYVNKKFGNQFIETIV